MDRDKNRISEALGQDSDDVERTTESDRALGDESQNPPRTTTGKWTSPKFGSAGSGGAELEPGPERD